MHVHYFMEIVFFPLYSGILRFGNTEENVTGKFRYIHVDALCLHLVFCCDKISLPVSIPLLCVLVVAE